MSLLARNIVSTSNRATTPAPPPENRLARHRQLAPAAAVRVAPVCLSTRLFTEDRTLNQVDASDILDRFYYLGGNFIDTDPGRPERWVGDWMTARRNRDEIVLSTKYGSAWRPREETRVRSNFGGNNAKSMKVALEASLANLQTTYVDIFYVAWWDHTTGIPELMHGLNDLVAAGKVLYLGITDTPAWVVSKANEYARQKGLRQFAVYCGLWGSASRDIERDVVPMCAGEGMAICALHRGSYAVPDGRRCAIPPQQQHGNDLAAVLQRLARAKGTAGYIDLAYIRAKAPYVFPVIPPRQ